MADPNGYPVTLRLQDRQTVVIGGGSVATRRVKRLLDAGARVLVISPRLSDELRQLAEAGDIEHIQARYQRDMLNAFMPLLVIAASNDEDANRMAAQDAERIRALCNLADGSAESDFSHMALISQPPLTLALSANGSSPALLRHLKARLESTLGGEYAVLAGWLGEIRQPLKRDIACQRERRQVYERVLESDVPRLLRDGETEQARQAFQRIINEATPQ